MRKQLSYSTYPGHIILYKNNYPHIHSQSKEAHLCHNNKPAYITTNMTAFHRHITTGIAYAIHASTTSYRTRYFRPAVLLMIIMICRLTVSATGYTPLDISNPIEFLGDRIVYDGDTILLGAKALFLDGNMSDEETKQHPFVHNTIQSVAAVLTDGTEQDPMRVYIAPYVYWADNPDVPDVVTGKDGREPFGMVIKCENLHLIGLTDDARNVVIASMRGQTQGAVGNFTMLDFHGDGLQVYNMTLGNFCNVDLDYPLRPSLGRKKRNEAITQAHVAYCHGDKVVARNVRFISRLNMNPLNGARRILFDRCHMECTDDALTGNGVYLKCTFGLYGQKPFYTTHTCGAVFLDCDFYAMNNNRHMVFCKAPGPLTLIDCRYHAADSTRVGWTNYPTPWLRCYLSDFILNGCLSTIGSEKPENTVNIEDTELLKAFRFSRQDTTMYNIYNLLRGDDNSDFAGWKSISEQYGCTYPLPTYMEMSHRRLTIQTGNPAVMISAMPKMHGGYNMPEGSRRQTVRWRVAQGAEEYVRLSAREGNTICISACNETDSTAHFYIEAYTDEGLCGAIEMEVMPSWLPAPEFTSRPRLSIETCKLTVDYALNLNGRPDHSIITWYRCRNASGDGAIPVAVSRGGQPEYTYSLTPSDNGWHIMATVQPQHNRSKSGPVTATVTTEPIFVTSGNNKNEMSIITDFRTFPTVNQPQILPGFWTVDGYKPADTSDFPWTFDNTKEMWSYAKGFNGAVGYGLVQSQRGARLMYTPVDGHYADMSLELEADPTKTAGQGFGSATGQYMDICLKFDTRTLTGYGLRIIRTTKYAKAVDFLLVSYNNGIITPLTDPVSAICYRTGCTIRLNVKGSLLSAHVETVTPLPDDSALARTVNLTADIVSNPFGGIAIQHTGTCGESTTMLHKLSFAAEICHTSE